MNRGFTLIELLAVVVIVIALALLITPKLSRLTNDNRTKAYKEIENRLEEAAKKYIVDEYIDSETTALTITKANLIEKGYIGEIYDLKDKSVCEGFVTITNLNTTPTYTVSLICSNYTSE